MRFGFFGIGLFLALFTAPALAEDVSCQLHHCVGIVDAGSTGSRLHFYTYDLDKHQTPIHIQEQWSKKIKPGLANLDLDQAQINHYLDNLFTHTGYENIPVYFYATAGMRILSSATQQAYFDQIKKWFEVQTQWKLVEAKTINGKDEGVYAWLAVNYNLGTLQNNFDSIGVIDIGGASVQIVFSPDQNMTLPSNRVAQFNLYGQSYTLYSHSALGLGQKSVEQQFLNTSVCYPIEYALTNGEQGEGDASKCEKEVSQLMNEEYHLSEELRPVLNPQMKDWYVMGGASYLARDLFLSDFFTAAFVLEQADMQACHQLWSSLQYLSDDMAHLCFNASHLYALVVDAYGIPENQPIHALSTDVDWTLGVVLSHK